MTTGSLSVNTVEAVQASFRRCDSPEFYDTFYETFLASSDEVRALFANTDFKRQKVILRTTITLMVRFQLPDPRAQDVFGNVGKTHSRGGYNVDPSFYELWLESLLAAIALHDPQASPEVAESWRAYVADGIDLIIAAY